MQKITVDLSQIAPSISSQYGGEMGEHQAVELTVIPETAMLQDESIEFYYILFKVNDGLVSSRTYNVGEEITCALWDQLTALKQLQFQLIGTNGEETIVSKSAIITLYLGDSLEGTVIGIDDNRDSLIAMIGAFNERLSDDEKLFVIISIGSGSNLYETGSETYEKYWKPASLNVTFGTYRILNMRRTENALEFFGMKRTFPSQSGPIEFRLFSAPLDGTYVTVIGDTHKIPTAEEYGKLVAIHTGEIAESDDGYVTGGDVYAALAAIPAPVQSDYAQNDPSAPDFIKNKPVDKFFFVEPGVTAYSEIAAANLADKICVIVNYHSANAAYYVLSNFYNEDGTDYAVFSAVELGGKLSYLTVDDNNVWTASSSLIPSDAEDIDYDNTDSGLTATDVQAAIDELAQGGGGFVVSDTAPSDTGVLWIDPSDDTTFPAGTNVGDLLVWNGTEWVAQTPEKPSRLPVGYQEVEYVEGTGTQYISLDFNPKSSDEFAIEVAFTGNVADGNYGVFGSFYSSLSNDRERFSIAYYRGKWQYAVGETAYETNVNADNNKHKFVLDAKNEIFTIDSTEIEMQTTPITGGATKIALFGRMSKYATDTPMVNDITPAKTYSAKIKRNGLLVADLIPCYKISSGTIGFYDRIGNEFYTNAGTGTFIKGADV